VRVPVDWPTAWAKKDKSGYYTLGQLWFWLVNTEISAGEYFRKTREFGIALVPTGEREAITHFFTVASATNLEELDERVRPETVIKLSHLKAGRLQAPAQLAEQMLKKRDSKHVEKVAAREKRIADFLLEGERKTAGKSTCLQAKDRSFL